uniref:WAP domain-containing protein n=1 Tax=Myotis lucifugus TaxID=59463 RepID=G1Q966_MYOLU
MKTGTVFVLVAIVILGMEMAFAQKRPPGGGEKPGFCPRLPKDAIGLCVEKCLGDDSCPGEMKCCGNGCGHVCKRAIH